MSVYFLEIDSDLFIMFTMLGSLFMPLGLVFAILECAIKVPFSNTFGHMVISFLTLLL